MLNFEYQNPTKILFGKGSINKLSHEILKYGNKVLLVYGGKSIKTTGNYELIMEQLKDITVVEFPNVTVPSLENLYNGINLAKKENVDVIIGIGGGCAIDMAKSIALGAANDVDIWDILTRRISYEHLKALPIGAIVTIAGSGSEMDGNSEIDNLETKEHGSIGSFIPTYPSFSILDPQLTYQAPFNVTAYHGVTILVQAMEQYVCNCENTPIQDGFVETICKVVMASLRTIKNNLADDNARGQLMWASALTTNRILGRGKNASWMGGVLGGMIDDCLGLTYAQGIAITWPKYLLVCYKDTLPVLKRFSIHVMDIDPSGLSDEEIVSAGMNKFQEFFDEMDIAHTTKDLGINASMSDVEQSIERVAKKNVISKEDLIKIMKLSLGE